jgi:FkbM family methyltransferase
MKLLLKKMLGLAPKTSKTLSIPIETHGEGYGGWVISKDSLSKDSKIFSVGIGKDVGFDLSIIKKYDSKVYGFDPTPGVDEWLKSQVMPVQFEYVAVALTDFDGDVNFYKPETEGYISHSISSEKVNQDFVSVPARSLASLMIQFDIEQLDVLKMDIESFEYGVIDSIMAQDCPVKQLLIEFHHGMYGKKVSDTEQAIEKIKSRGYRIFHISESGREMSFIKNSALESGLN